MPPEGLEFENGILTNGTGDIIARVAAGEIYATGTYQEETTIGFHNGMSFEISDPRDERIAELENRVEALLQMVEHLRIQAKEAGVIAEPMTLSEILINSEQKIS